MKNTEHAVTCKLQVCICYNSNLIIRSGCLRLKAKELSREGYDIFIYSYDIFIYIYIHIVWESIVILREMGGWGCMLHSVSRERARVSKFHRSFIKQCFFYTNMLSSRGSNLKFYKVKTVSLCKLIFCLNWKLSFFNN